MDSCSPTGSDRPILCTIVYIASMYKSCFEKNLFLMIWIETNGENVRPNFARFPWEKGASDVRWAFRSGSNAPRAFDSRWRKTKKTFALPHSLGLELVGPLGGEGARHCFVEVLKVVPGALRPEMWRTARRSSRPTLGPWKLWGLL